MTTHDLAKKLISLIHLDIDAIHAYNEAIHEIDIPEIAEQLRIFQQDHRDHVRDLSPFVVQQGEEPPIFKKDFKGYLIAGFTALRSKAGTEQALKAMKANEQLTNATYSRALTWEIPSEIRSIVEKNRDDERRHLKYIEEQIELKVSKKNEAA